MGGWIEQYSRFKKKQQQPCSCDVPIAASVSDLCTRVHVWSGDSSLYWGEKGATVSEALGGGDGVVVGGGDKGF